MTKNIAFQNTEIAFSVKSDKEIKKAYNLFKLIQNNKLVNIGAKFMNWALKNNLPVKGIIKNTVFGHFCGGESIDESLVVAQKIFEKGVYSILDYSVEGKQTDKSFDAVVETTIQIMKNSSKQACLPITVFKPTGIGREELYEKKSSKTVFTEAESIEWTAILKRYDKLVKTAKEYGLIVLVDAEHYAIQNAVDDIVEQLMERYNKEEAIIYGTLQMYRQDRLDYIKSLYKRAQKKGYHIGMKLVRGAYMEQERIRAQEKGYPDPICKTKQDTDNMYNAALDFMFEHINTMAIYLGTHNEESVLRLKDKIDNANLVKKNKAIWFGQLYGMSDHITFNLANLGYNSTKYMPFGPVKDVMPYLIRRADENTAVGDQTSRELDLLLKERQRRNI